MTAAVEEGFGRRNPRARDSTVMPCQERASGKGVNEVEKKSF
jgi:hypothetical protein